MAKRRPRGFIGPFHGETVGGINAQAKGEMVIGETEGGKSLRQGAPFLLAVDGGTGGAGVTRGIGNAIHAQRKVGPFQLGDAGGVVINRRGIVGGGGEGVAPRGGERVLVRQADAQGQQGGGMRQPAEQTDQGESAGELGSFHGFQVLVFRLTVDAG